MEIIPGPIPSFPVDENVGLLHAEGRVIEAMVNWWMVQMLSHGVSMTYINVLRDRGDPQPGVNPRLLQAVEPAAPPTQS